MHQSIPSDNILPGKPPRNFFEVVKSPAPGQNFYAKHGPRDKKATCPRGMFSTSEGVQYIGGYHDECGGYHEYIGGCSVHRRDTMSTSGGYHEYIGGCSVHRRDIMIHVGEQLDKIISISIENSDVLNIPRCTLDIPPMYSWYLPHVS